MVSTSGESLSSPRAAVVLLAVLSLVAALLPLGVAGAADDATRDAVPGAAVGPGVRERVLQRAAGGPPIVVALSDAVGAGDSLERRVGATRAAQQRVLDRLPSTGAKLRFRGEAVPVMTFDVTTLEALDALASAPGVERIDVDGSGTGDLTEVVSVLGLAPSHAAGFTGEGVRVAVFDTGIDRDHPDLADDLVHEECFGYDGAIDAAGFCPNGLERQSGAGSAEDDAGHGTHVNGIITSKGVVAPVGTAPDAEMVVVKVMDDCSFAGCFYSFTESVTAPLDWIIANNATWGIDLINASLGTSERFAGDCDVVRSWTSAAAAAVDTLHAMGVAFVASAGNEFDDAMGAPACLSNVIAVGASTDVDAAAGFSNASATTDVFAPGVGVVSDAIGGGTTSRSGTSMASPATVGCAAVLLEAGHVNSPTSLEARLEASPVSIAAHGRSYPRVTCDTTLATAPGAPSSVTGLRGDSSVAVSWTPGADGGAVVTGFTVTASPGGASCTTSSTGCTVPGLVNGTPYSFTVTATNVIGTGPPSSPKLLVTPSTPTSCGVGNGGPFPDVGEDHPFCSDIEWLIDEGVTTGYADGGFHPTSAVSRQSMAAFLYRFAGLPAFTPPATASFPDVPTGHPFFAAIEWLASGGVTGGYADGGFHPASAVSRQSMAAFLHRFAGVG